MDLFELQDFLKKEYEGKEIKFSFPPETHRIYEIVLTDGKPNPEHHIECRAVNVLIEGESPYIQKLTSPHRLTITHEHMLYILKETILTEGNL